MDRIKIGLDFGTHQSKICVQRIPDEGHGEPCYEFFQFTDLQGNMQFFCPQLYRLTRTTLYHMGMLTAKG